MNPELPFAVPEGFESWLEDELVRLCSISSASDDPQGVAAMAHAYGAALAEAGLAVGFEEHGGGPVLVALAPGANPPYTLVVGHLDTVLHAGPVRREGGRLFATGAVDMKGGLVALLGALRLLPDREGLRPKNLAVVLVPDEESTGAASKKAIAAWGKHAKSVLVVEPGEARNGRETLVLGRKGMAEFCLQVRGVAAHSGLAFHHGRSAAVAAARFVMEAQRLITGGQTVNVSRMVVGDQAFVADLPHQAHILATSQRLNIVPDAATVVGEFRFPEEDEGEAMADALQALARSISRELGVTMELTLGQWVAPVEARAGMPLAERAKTLAHKLGLELEIETSRGGISLTNFLGRPELPVLDGLGPVGGGMHTREEFVELASLHARAKLLAMLLANLADQDEPSGE
ncbi:MAG: peptidase [Thermoanaerobaculum sp.]|nr:MAG: peptidase [Thermoanaerobaculum sp.]